jgi:AraC-like DNA-binding protein
MEAEQRAGQPGWQAIVNQYVQILFHQTLRAFVSCGKTAPEPSDVGSADTSSLVTDPIIGLVVGLLHAQPDKPWTVASLARWVNMSRSAFSERFREVVGSPPLHYLTELRMARACELLKGSDLGVKQIAGLVGYESPSSFTNAFKRWHGVSPATYRVHDDSAEPCQC